MKKTLMASLVVVSLVAVFAIPAFAHAPAGEAAAQTEDVWDDMYEACLSGDWEAMTEAAQDLHGGNTSWVLGPADNNEGLGTDTPFTGAGWDAMDEVMDDVHTDSNDNMPAPGAGWGATGGHMGGSAGMSMWRR